MRALYAKWVAGMSGITKSSRDTYVSTMAPFFDWAEEHGFGVNTIEPDDIAAYIEHAQKDNGTNQVSYRVALLGRFFRWAVRVKQCDLTPIQKDLLPRLRPTTPEKVPFDYEQMQSILAEMVENQEEHYYAPWWPAAIRIAWHTGLRISDVSHLRWDAIDFERKLMTVRPIKKKSLGEVLVIPIEPDLLAYLQEMEHLHEEWVLPYMRWVYDNARKKMVMQFRRACDRCGLKDHSFHSFRHGFVTRLINARVDPITIGSMTGQCVEQVAEYAHISNAAKVAALEASRQAIAAVSQPTPNLKVA